MKRFLGVCGFLFVTTAFAAPLPANVLEAKVNDAMQDHAELNPTYWKGDKMDPAMRTKLNQIGHVKFEELKKSLPNIKLQEIIFSGSLANYNYTKSSDVDVHIVVDINKVSCDKRVTNNYIMLTNKYSHATANLMVLDTPLQVTISSSLHETGGAYSLMRGRWIQKPTHPNPTYTKSELTEQVKMYHSKIDALQQAYAQDASTSDCQKAKKLSRELSSGRTAGLKRDGYSSIENNVYRILRNVGDIKVLREIKKQCRMKEA